MEGVGIFMEIGRMIALYMEYCRSKQLRPKTMLSYEQTIKLFARWLKEVEGIDQVEQIKEATIRHYILELQSRGKYTFYAVEAQESTNCPKRRRDYKKPVGNITINNYLRNLSPYLDIHDQDLKKKYYKYSPLDNIFYG